MALAPEPSPPGVDEAASRGLEAVGLASAHLKGAFDDGPVGLCLLDPGGSIRWCTAGWRRLLDVRGPLPVALDDWLHRVPATEAESVSGGIGEVIDRGTALDTTLSFGPGASLRLLARRADPDEPRSGIVAALTAEVGRDPASASTEDADRWAHHALHDPLTGLPNRLLFGDHLLKALARCERDGSRVALLYFDVDRFKAVNDTQGHEAGDVLLGLLADRLTAVLRPSDTVARLGGDEFVVLFDRVEDEQDAVVGGRRITEAIEAEPFALPDMDLPVTVSAGVTLSRSGIAPETLLREADAAMYRAKERGRARLEVYDEVLRRRAERRVSLAHRLHEAIEAEQITVHYQPCADLISGRVVAIEALARWTGTDGADEDFLDVAVDSGLIVPLGQLVLREACAEAARWDRACGGTGPRVHVNLADRQIHEPGIVSAVARTLEETGVRPDTVCLEIPERALTRDPQAAGAVLAELKALGLVVAVDDFGTASSSLPHLRDLDIDVIKVDRSFVDGLGPDPEDTAIVAAIVSIAHSLGMEAVAEGVETIEQVAELKALGCDLAQGFLFSHPVPATELGPFLDHVFAV